MLFEVELIRLRPRPELLLRLLDLVDDHLLAQGWGDKYDRREEEGRRLPSIDAVLSRGHSYCGARASGGVRAFETSRLRVFALPVFTRRPPPPVGSSGPPLSYLFRLVPILFVRSREAVARVDDLFVRRGLPALSSN